MSISCIQELKGGNINKLYYCRTPDDVQEDDVVILKVNGALAEGFMDCEKEAVNMMVANSVRMAAPLYCRSV